jgi:hypothetical protein
MLRIKPPFPRIDGQPAFENPAITSQIALIREGGDTVEDSEKVQDALRYASRHDKENIQCPACQPPQHSIDPSLPAAVGRLPSGFYAACLTTYA